jgi:excisionase family DNA binding protein
MSAAGVKQRATYELPRLALSIEEACGALGISWDLWDAHVAHEIRMVRLGRRRLVPVAELQKWLAEHAELAVDDD